MKNPPSLVVLWFWTWIGLLLIAGVLAVPWDFVPPSHAVMLTGSRSPLFFPPTPPHAWMAQVNIGMLAAQCLAASILSPLLAFPIYQVLKRRPLES